MEPDHGGGQVLFRSRSVASGIELRVGDSVRYALADGGFAREAVAVTPADVDGEERT